jgi:hypothetical protein
MKMHFCVTQLLVISLCACNSIDRRTSNTPLNVDQLHGLAAVNEYIEKNPNHEELPSFDPSRYVVEKIADPNGRRYIFLGFPLDAKSGYMVIFESCPGAASNYSLSVVGLSANLPKERAGFLAAASDVGTDYPSPCGDSHR